MSKGKQAIGRPRRGQTPIRHAFSCQTRAALRSDERPWHGAVWDARTANGTPTRSRVRTEGIASLLGSARRALRERNRNKERSHPAAVVGSPPACHAPSRSLLLRASPPPSPLFSKLQRLAHGCSLQAPRHLALRLSSRMACA